jgi:proteasome lid subunit RPN8/RPN11
MTRLVLTVPCLDRILAHLEGAYPEEGCGALLGREADRARLVVDAPPLANAAARNRRRRYEVAPADLVRTQREARARGLEILGFYHSHPDAEPAPSEHDRAAAWPWYVYLIVGIGAGRARGATAWRLRDDRTAFDPVPIEIVEQKR